VLDFSKFTFKDAFTAFHNDMKKVTKYMKPLEIGKLHPDEASHRDVNIYFILLHKP
jgi:hypothetical protein